MTLSVEDAIRKVLPFGTDPNARESGSNSINEPPLWPPDLFGVAAHLLYRSSAYHRVIAADVSFGAPPSGSLQISTSEVLKYRKIGQIWSKNAACPKEVIKFWDQLLKHSAQPLCDLHQTRSKPAPWWKPAYALMAIADEACSGVGYMPSPGEDWEKQWIVRATHVLLNGSLPDPGKTRNVRVSLHTPTITSHLVDRDVLCVQPKARTPDVGCSLRNLSHNLALLPPRGVMRVHWLAPNATQLEEKDAPLHLLLIPFPYVIDPSWFQKTMATAPTVQSPWGWFDLNQRWLNHDPNLVLQLVRRLIEIAEKDEIVSGVVFPEYALTYEIHERLAKMLRDNYPGVQFIVSGASSNCSGDTGNFALSSFFFNDRRGAPVDSRPNRMMATVSRPKHHRWSLDYSQQKSYGFNPSDSEKNVRWWEKIELKPREIHINAMRCASVFTAMICEDLARSDPVHEPLKAVGPNLVFVLLMDGPQLEWRWSTRYSTGLAEDPGSSVLTLTSRGLVSRWNDQRPPTEQSWSIGIWKDEANRASEIKCPPGQEAVMLRLRGNEQIEQTIDGRSNMQTYAWHRIGDTRPISLDRDIDAALIAKLNMK